MFDQAVERECRGGALQDDPVAGGRRLGGQQDELSVNVTPCLDPRTHPVPRLPGLGQPEARVSIPGPRFPVGKQLSALSARGRVRQHLVHHVLEHRWAAADTGQLGDDVSR